MLNKTASDPTSLQPVLTTKRPRDEPDANLPDAKVPKEAQQQPAEPGSMVPELLGVICEMMEELAGMEYVVRRDLACCVLPTVVSRNQTCQAYCKVKTQMH